MEGKAEHEKHFLCKIIEIARGQIFIIRWWRNWRFTLRPFFGNISLLRRNLIILHSFDTIWCQIFLFDYLTQGLKLITVGHRTNVTHVPPNPDLTSRYFFNQIWSSFHRRRQRHLQLTISTYLVSHFTSIQVHVKVLKQPEIIFIEQTISSQRTKNLEPQDWNITINSFTWAELIQRHKIIASIYTAEHLETQNRLNKAKIIRAP